MLESLEPRLLLSATPMTAAVVTTDHLDYAPGETAVITTSNQTGEGLQFAAGELVRFQVSRTDGMADAASTTENVGSAGNAPWYVMDGIGGFAAHQEFDVNGQAVDRDGNGVADWIAPDNDLTVNSSISTTWFVEEQYRNSTLLVTAAGQESGAVATHAFTDAKINTTTTVSSSAATSIYGNVVTFTAQVTPAVGHARPAGSVEFFDGTRSLGIDSTVGYGSGTISIFTVSISNLTAGAHSIHAVFTAGTEQEHGPSGFERHDGHEHRERHGESEDHRRDGDRQEHRRQGRDERHHSDEDHAHREELTHRQFNDSSSGNLSQTVSQKSLTGNFTVASKVYDGTTLATVQTRMLAGAIAGDDVSLLGGTAAFTDANVGESKTVTLAGATLTGTAASNYSLTLPVTTTATISQATVTITGNALNGRGYLGVYDGQAHAATATVTGVGGVNLGTVASSTTATDAGVTSHTVTFLGNVNYASATKVLTSTIVQAKVTITGNALNGRGYLGVYDGQAHAATATVTGVGGVNLGTVASSTTATNVGVTTHTVDFLGNANYKAATKNLIITIL